MSNLSLENVSIIIPTYREAENISELLARIAAVDFGARNFEVILIDDNSQDGTVELVQQLSNNFPWLKLLVRSTSRSLSESLLMGFEQARYPLLVVMDADLSHPPEKIPEMLTTLTQPTTDFVIGSRYIKGGATDEQWSLLRKLLSKSAAQLARIVLHRRVADPLSGFFALRKSTLANGASLTPLSWKIGLEIMIKCRCQHIKEIPIHFSKRHRGYSKLNWQEMWNYLKHLQQLARNR